MTGNFSPIWMHYTNTSSRRNLDPGCFSRGCHWLGFCHGHERKERVNRKRRIDCDCCVEKVAVSVRAMDYILHARGLCIR